jgi:hypothetical protein
MTRRSDAERHHPTWMMRSDGRGVLNVRCELDVDLDLGLDLGLRIEDD